MSIRYVSGKPGGGKSMYATQCMVDEVVTSERTIVTNVPLVLDQLQDYLLSLGHKIDVFKRFRILTEEETFDFWRHRGIDFDMPSHPRVSTKDGDKPDPNFDDNFNTPDVVSHGSCFFVIDELHLFFNSRQWKETGRWAIRYLSQHRHLGDDVICVTQSVANVDKQFRSLMQDITYLRNFRVEKWSYFAAPNKFTATTFLSAQPDGAPKDTRQAVATKDFKLDVKGLASCYKSTGGVGMPGMQTADLGKRAKGIPLWSIFIFLLLGGSIFLFVIFGGSPMLTKAIFPKSLEKTSDQKTSDQKTSDQKTLYTVFTSNGKNSTWQCTDGRTIALADVQSYTQHSVTLKDGTVIYKQQLTQQNSSHENLGNQTRQSNSPVSSVSALLGGGPGR